MANKVRVLVVDEEVASLSKMYINLLLKNYDVEATCRASEVLPRIKRFRPDVVIISPMLAGLEPHALCSTAKELGLCFIVLVSEEGENLPKIGNCTASDTLMRPVDIHQLERKIGGVLV